MDSLAQTLDETVLEQPERRLLHEDYYRDHFWVVFGDIEQRYHQLLNTDDRQYIHTIRSLSSDALCLYVRLVNRKGSIFRVTKLNYLTPVSLHNAITELEKVQLLQPVIAKPEDCNAFLSLFTLQELKSYLADEPVPKGGKRELCAWLKDHNDWPELAAGLLQFNAVIELLPSSWPFLKFLYFGQITDNLSDFVVQALGHVKTEQIDDIYLTARFATRRAADDCYRIHNLYEVFRKVRHDLDGASLTGWWHDNAITRADLDCSAHDLYDRLVERLGRILERHDKSAAIAIYRYSPDASRERFIKLLMKQGERDEAMSLCETWLTQPRDAEEKYALQQFWNRYQKNEKKTEATRILNEYPFLMLEWNEGGVEQAVLDHYAAKGWQGVHSENWLWCNLFGLLFWDMIFDAQHGGFHNQFQTAPQQLFKPSFFKNRLLEFTERLSLLNDVDLALTHLSACHDQKKGVANPFVAWHDDTLAMIDIFVRRLPPAAIAAVLDQMGQDLNTGCRGFPDLFLWKDDDYKFIEVKSVTDRIQPQQFNWLQLFKEHNINSSVLRVLRKSNVQ